MLKCGLQFKISTLIKLGINGSNEFINDLYGYLNAIGDEKKEDIKCVRITFSDLGKIDVRYRLNTSDIFWISEILISRQNALLKGIYDYFNYPRVDYILDLGANIGTFTLYMKNHFPTAKVLAVEPEHQNYVLLKENTMGIKNIETIEAGIWYKKTYLNIINPMTSKDGFICEELSLLNSEIDSSMIEAIDIDSLIDEFNIQGKILIKMDIEGAEEQVFDKISDCKWIDKVDILIIEIHDHIKPNLSYKIMPKLIDRGFYYRKISDNYFCTKRKMLFPENITMVKDKIQKKYMNK